MPDLPTEYTPPDQATGSGLLAVNPLRGEESLIERQIIKKSLPGLLGDFMMLMASYHFELGFFTSRQVMWKSGN